MLFNTYHFMVVFALLALLTFYLLRRFASPSLALASIVVASLLFYAYWRADYVPILVLSILINYGIGTTIRAWPGLTAGVALFIGVALNVSFLGYFKYAHFAVAQTNAAFGFQFSDPAVILPLAVSFYTFQQIAYVTDCYRGKIHDNNFLRYAFVVTFFPHLVAGPIVRMQEISHQFATAFTKPALQNICIGLALFTIGLGKKVLVADYFGSIANPKFDSVEKTGSVDFIFAWTAALSYTLQLHFDFSGYSDMAIGLARMFGFRLAVNFLSPYQSRNIADFWRRWHITLSRFLRDYLYIPLGGSRKRPFRTYLNLIVTMALGGLWHGAAWTFVAWGIYHGTLLALHRAWKSVLPKRIIASWWYVLASAALTFICVVIGWVLFRAPTFEAAGVILRGMISTPHYPDGGKLGIILIGAALTFCWFAPNVYQVLYRFRPALLLRKQVPLARKRLVFYTFHFRTVEAFALSAVLIVSLTRCVGQHRHFYISCSKLDMTLATQRMRGFLTAMLAPVIAAVLAGFIMNIYVDPLWILPLRSSDSTLRYCVKDERQNKINRALHGHLDSDSVLIGSSRSAFIDPLWFKEHHVFNMSVNGMTPVEYSEFVRIYREQHEGPSSIFVGFGFFGYAASQVSESQVDDIRKRETVSKAKFYPINQAIDFSNIEYSFDTLKTCNSPSNHSPFYLYDGRRGVDRAHYDKEHMTFVAGQIKEISDIFNSDKFSPDPLFTDRLSKLANVSTESNLVVFVLPTSVDLFISEMKKGHISDYIAWMHKLVAAFGAVYHFNGINRFTTNPLNFLDSHHIYADRTERVAATIEGRRPSDADGFGMRVTEKNFGMFEGQFRETTCDYIQRTISETNGCPK